MRQTDATVTVQIYSIIRQRVVVAWRVQVNAIVAVPICGIIQEIVAARRIYVDANVVVQYGVIQEVVIARRIQPDAIVVVRYCNILYHRIICADEQHSFDIFCQYQISRGYIRWIHDSHIASIVWNLLILFIDPVIDWFSIHCVTCVYFLNVVRKLVATNTEVVFVFRYRVVYEVIIARIP